MGYKYNKQNGAIDTPPSRSGRGRGPGGGQGTVLIILFFFVTSTAQRTHIYNFIINQLLNTTITRNYPLCFQPFIFFC